MPTLLVLALLAPGADAPAADLRFDADYPKEARADLELVAKDVLAACRRRWPGTPPAGKRRIVIYYRAAGPLTDSTTDPKTYRIYLAVKDRSYPRFAYQLAHEFAHVMLDPRRTNGLVETFAVAFSLVILDDLAARWAKTPPDKNWTNYAPTFKKYRKLAEDFYLKNQPLAVRALANRKAYKELAIYLRYRRATLNDETDNRELQHLAALALLSGPVKWANLVGLAGHTNPPPSKDGKFRSDLALLPEKLPAIVKRVGFLRTGELLSAELTSKPAVKDGFAVQLGPRKWLWLYETKAVDGKLFDRLKRELKPAVLRREKGE